MHKLELPAASLMDDLCKAVEGVDILAFPDQPLSGLVMEHFRQVIIEVSLVAQVEVKFEGASRVSFPSLCNDPVNKSLHQVAVAGFLADTISVIDLAWKRVSLAYIASACADRTGLVSGIWKLEVAKAVQSVVTSYTKASRARYLEWHSNASKM